MAVKAKKKKAGAKAINAYVKPVPFGSMNAAQRRVAIAEDVIAGINAKRFIATQGTYVELREASCELNPDETVDVQKVLAENVKTCEVCAKGAMFIAAVEKFNKFKLDGIESEFDLSQALDSEASQCDHLGKYFSKDTLDLIEEIFEESDDYGYGITVSDEEDLAKAAYVVKYPDAEDRLIAIMENIIANKGDFVLKVNVTV